MSEDKGNEEGTAEGTEEDDSTEGSGATLETVTVQKRKALEQRDEARTEKAKLIEELEAERAKTKEVDAPTPAEVPTPNNEDDWKQKIEFTIANQHLGEEVIQEVLSQAKAKGITTAEALELPVVKAFVDATKSEQAVVNATPTGGRSPRVQPPKPISEMNREERKDYHAKLVGLK